MRKKNTFRISVRDLVAAAQMELGGPKDLGRSVSSGRRAMAGIREHTRLQDLWPQSWNREVPVSLKLEKQLFVLEIFGRMDGLCVTGSGVTVQEIKTCQKDPAALSLKPKITHLAQVKCYGYMTAKERGLSSIRLILTYARPDDGKTAAHEKTHTFEELETFFDKLVSTYLSLLGSRTAWERIRNQSVRDLEFPYSGFRDGQRDLAEAVYKIIKHDRILFARAPTGTGKTMATLFPAIKAMGLGQTDKIFYLTAKSPGRTVALKALKDLATAGARIKSVVITAKAKTCFTPDFPCDMETCVYAQAYYTKQATAMARLSGHDLFDQALIEKTARECELCPFEFSLDLSLTCDVIICDLNYAFDPRVYLKRFFDRDAGKLTFLMDEAHNLPDRLRSMYSADLEKEAVLTAQAILRDTAPALARGLVAIHKEMVRLQTAYIPLKEFHSLTDLPAPFMDTLEKFASRAELWLDTHPSAPVRDIVLDIFYTINGFLNLARQFGSHYRLFIHRSFIRSPENQDLCIRLFCLDPAPIFARLIKRCRSAVLFSATFFPFDYYDQVLFGSLPAPDSDPDKKQSKSRIAPHFVSIDSPFPRKNFKLVIHTCLKTTFRQRSRFYKDLAQLIIHTHTKRPGNHLIFFSSYAYMEAVLDLIDPDLMPGTIQIQTRRMDEDDRLSFLNNYTPKSRVTGFAVMGGIFGEGIDLAGDRLTTVMVIGVGLPQVNHEQEEIRAYYDALLAERRDQAQQENDLDGFFIAYQMPGFSRVLQAVGRLIRSGSDRGMALLMDERFVRPDYLRLFPLEWEGFDTISSPHDLDRCLDQFPMEKINN